MSWIVIAISCDDCGSQCAFSFFDYEPTETDKSDVAREIGGMWCIKILVKQIEGGIINTIDKLL